MADIELVVKIPEEYYENLLKNCRFSSEEIPIVSLAIATGTPLPKGHGRLIDEDEIPGDWSWDFADRIDETPTIIEADKEQKHDT